MATVLKPGGDARRPHTQSLYDMRDFAIEGRKMLSYARAESDRIIAEARQQAEQMKRGGYERGFAEGKDAGYQQGYPEGFEKATAVALEEFSKKRATAVRTCEQTVEQIEAQKHEMFRQAERDVLELAVAIARKLTKTVTRFDRDAAVENLKVVLTRTGRKTHMTIRVNPEDLSAVRFFATELYKQWKQSEHLTVVDDSSVAPGGCRVEYGQGIVDAGIDGQLERISTLLLGSKQEKD